MLYTYKVVEKSLTWSFVSNVRQTFYDMKHRLLTIKNGSSLEFMPMSDSKLNLPASISLRTNMEEEPVDEVLALGYSLSMKSVCYQTSSKRWMEYYLY